jgi:hypothetical protein
LKQFTFDYLAVSEDSPELVLNKQGLFVFFKELNTHQPDKGILSRRQRAWDFQEHG